MHSCGVLHRDIKDENVIINERFEVKLIDFGSAVLHKPGIKMHTFYGTIEYCSPEVLEGNPYEGPELEVWSLGVLLYIIIFWENPFFNIEETIRCRLLLPHQVSPGCVHLVRSILVKDPKQRLTLQQVCEDQWLRQEVDPANYNFQDIVRCSKFGFFE
jgi:PAS domain-containing serine/threonine kinase